MRARKGELMRRWLFDLHLYLGLLCLPYLVVFGVSSILLNHDLRNETTTEWQREIAAPSAESDTAQSAATLEALALTGSVLAHTVKRDEAGGLHFEASRPGRRYQVELLASGQARVRESRGGVLGISRGLHGHRDTQSSLWSLSWALYTELATAVLLFSIASGVVLIWPRRGERAFGLGFGALGLAAVALMAAAIW
jgi:hypothetical protein